MAVTSLRTPRLAPSIATKKSTKRPSATEGNIDLDDLIAATASMPTGAASFRGARPSLPACPGAMLKSSEPPEETSNKDLGRYATPSCKVSKTKSTGAHTPRRHSDVTSARGLTVPTAPSTPHSGRPKGPLKKSSTHHAADVKGLSTQKLGVILRRNSDLRNGDPDDECEDAVAMSLDMTMIKAKSDMPRPTTSAADGSASLDIDTEMQVVRRPSQQEQLVSRLLLSDDERVVTSSKEVSDSGTRVGAESEGISEKQKRKLDGRRRSFELQAMLNSVENQDGADMVQLLQNSEDSAPITNDVQSKEDEYWSSMWQMTRSMMDKKSALEDLQVPTLDVAEPGLAELSGL